MCMKSLRRGLSTLAIATLASACGGRSGLFTPEDLGGGANANAAPSPGASSSSSSTVPPGLSGGQSAAGSMPHPGTPQGTPPSTSNVSPTGSASPDMAASSDASCDPNVPAYMPVGDASISCWTCAAQGCQPQLKACRAECPCSDALGKALACLSAGTNAITCFQPPATADSAWSAVTSCIVSAGAQCGCPSNLDVVPGNGVPLISPSDSGPGTEPSDAASSSCKPTLNGATSGGQQCHSDLTWSCGGAQHEVICGCPQGTCVCFGNSSKVIPYKGCPYCPLGPGGPGATTPDDLFAQCGFGP
jgi:hypothetical protein